MNIKKEIRNILIEMFNEAAPSLHFKERVYDRLSSSLNTRPSFNFSDIEREIELLKKTNFNPNESYAIQLKTFQKTFVSKDPNTGIPSVGNEIWAVVRDNKITTIFFRNSSQKNIPVKNVDNTIRFKAIFNNYKSSEKNKDGTVDFQVNTQTQKKGQRKSVELDLPSIDIKGVKWYIDEDNEKLIYAKNTKKTLSFDDLQEEILEKIINAVITHNAA